MPGEHNFEHLPLVLRDQGRAKLSGGGKSSPQTDSQQGRCPSIAQHRVVECRAED